MLSVASGLQSMICTLDDLFAFCLSNILLYHVFLLMQSNFSLDDYKEPLYDHV